MSEQNKGGHSFKHDILETKYPYINVKEGVVNETLSSIRRGISGVNPFSQQQVPDQTRAAIGHRFGNSFFLPEPYPNDVHFNRLFPSHYDPLGSEKRQSIISLYTSHAPAQYSHLIMTRDKLPKGCVRTIQNLRRCVMVNGKQKCKEEANEISRICPNWALDSMMEKQKFALKVRAIVNQQYKDVMEVSEYNKGRTAADVAEKTWIDGTRHRLRPDTMWPDARYSKITQKEINEAKERVRERDEKARKQDAMEGKKKDEEPRFDDKGDVHIKREKRLYP